MTILKTLSALVAAVCTIFAAPALAEEPKMSEKELAVCMWEKAPDDAQKAMDAQNPFQLAAALANGGEVCGAASGSVNIETMRKALRKAQPKKSKRQD